MRSQKLNERKRKQRLLSLWEQLFLPEERTEDKVASFGEWLGQNHPELLKRAHGDPCQQLRVDLDGHIRPIAE